MTPNRRGLHRSAGFSLDRGPSLEIRNPSKIFREAENRQGFRGGDGIRVMSVGLSNRSPISTRDSRNEIKKGCEILKRISSRTSEPRQRLRGEVARIGTEDEEDN